MNKIHFKRMNEEKEIEVEMNTKMLISNTVRIAIFATLAIVFKEWWIVLLSVLFLTSKTDSDDE